MQIGLSAFFKKIWIYFAAFVIVVALICSFFRSLTPWITPYHHQIEAYLSKYIGCPVTFQSLEADWYWGTPLIKFCNLSLRVGEQVFEVKELDIGMHFLPSLWARQVDPSRLYISGLHLNIQEGKDNWQIGRLSIPKTSESAFEFPPFLQSFLLGLDKVRIKDISVDLHLKNGVLLPFKDIQLKSLRYLKGYQVKGKATLSQAQPTTFEGAATLSAQPEGWNIQSYLAVDDLFLKQWQGLVPLSPYPFVDGKGKVQLWANFKQGQWQNIQSLLAFSDLRLKGPQAKNPLLLNQLEANVALQRKSKGWLFSADHIKLCRPGFCWPENRVLISYDSENEEYFTNLDYFFLPDPLVTLFFQWPKNLEKNPLTQLKGNFHPFQLRWYQKEGLATILTNFDAVCLPQQAPYPGFKGLSGVLNWEPQEGHLEIDSQDLLLQMKDFPPLTLPLLNAVIDWKALSHGWRFRLDHFVLKHPNLLWTLNGVLDEWSGKTLGQLSLESRFSLKEGENLLQYLPKNYMPAPLYQWLTQNIKKLEQVGGVAKLSGPLEDFPFDKTEDAYFSMQGYLKGVDLFFNKDWPLTSNLEGNWSVDKNNLTIQILKAKLKDILISQGKLQILALGSQDKFILDTKLQTSAEAASAYIKDSPLKSKLAAIDLFTVDAPINLDLGMNFPLRSLDKLKLNGALRFDKNTFALKGAKDFIVVKDLVGPLLFNEEGFSNSQLKGLFRGSPLFIFIQALNKPKPMTRFAFHSKLNTSDLNALSQGILAPFLKGSFAFDLSLDMKKDESAPHLKLLTDLHGLASSLPAPLKKTVKMSVPLKIEADLSDKGLKTLSLNYNQLLGLKLWLSERPSHFDKIFHVSPSLVASSTTPNSTQHVFDLNAWLKVLASLRERWKSDNSEQPLKGLALQLQTMQIGSGYYPDFFVTALLPRPDEWTIEIQQEKINALLSYQPKEQKLKAEIKQLHLDDSGDGKISEQQSPLKLSPDSFPQMDLHIQSFQWGPFALGEVILKTERALNALKLPVFKIINSAYIFSGQGEWTQKQGKDKTTFEALLTVKNLAETLNRWQITPVVESKAGQVHFKGSWDSTLIEPKLGLIRGNLALDFRRGRITHLSHETEEKLGLGKILSILSLQTLPRRLKLDFSDLSKEGYSFDKFTGHFSIKEGILATTDSTINGPVAFAAMGGNIDLNKKWYDMELKIVPHITASLPLVATIAGGPVVGMATWVASKLLNRGVERISSYTYKITGPWEHPVVQPTVIVKQSAKTS